MVLARVHYQHACIAACLAGRNHKRPPGFLKSQLNCREDLIGIIIVKELILVDKDAGVRVGDLKLRSAPQLKSDTRLYDMLRLFETGRCHLAVLVQAPGKPVVTGDPGLPQDQAHICCCATSVSTLTPSWVDALPTDCDI